MAYYILMNMIRLFSTVIVVHERSICSSLRRISSVNNQNTIKRKSAIHSKLYMCYIFLCCSDVGFLVLEVNNSTKK